MRKICIILVITSILAWVIFGLHAMWCFLGGLAIGCLAFAFICVVWHYFFKYLNIALDWLYIKVCWVFGYYAKRGNYYWHYRPKSVGPFPKENRTYTTGY